MLTIIQAEPASRVGLILVLGLMPSIPAYVHLVPGSALPLLDAPPPFLAVVVAEQSVPPDWQSQVSDWLLQSGCLYMMAWGQDCSSWDDSVDLANLSAFEFGDIPEDQFVMTTWHADEPLKDVFWFAKNSASHPTVELQGTVLVHVAGSANKQALLRAYDEA